MNNQDENEFKLLKRSWNELRQSIINLLSNNFLIEVNPTKYNEVTVLALILVIIIIISFIGLIMWYYGISVIIPIIIISYCSYNYGYYLHMAEEELEDDKI